VDALESGQPPNGRGAKLFTSRLYQSPEQRGGPHRDSAAANPIWETTEGGAHWRETDLHHVLAFATGGGFVYVVTGSCGDGVCRNVLLRRAALGANSWSSTALPVGLIDPIVELAVHGA
jgi:hypothetical protein